MKTTKALVKFDFDVAVITALDAKYKDIQITDGASYAIVMGGLAEYRGLRTKIDALHKEYKKDILEAGRSLDGDKNRLKCLLEPGENHLKGIRQVEDDRKDAIKEEKEAKERERIEAIQDKINTILVRGSLSGRPSSDIENTLNQIMAMEISKDVFQEFEPQAFEAQNTAVAELEKALADRLQFEKEETERKAEVERLEKVRIMQEEAQKEIDEANRQIDEKKAKLEKEAFERKAQEDAENKAKLKLGRELDERMEREATEAKEKARKEAMKPDKEKLIKFSDQLYDIECPTVKSTKAQKISAEARNKLGELAQDVRAKAKKL